nr:hypothetical protein [Flavobacterium sp. Root935]
MSTYIRDLDYLPDTAMVGACVSYLLMAFAAVSRADLLILEAL